MELPDGVDGDFTETFPCYTQQCTIKIRGYTHTRNDANPITGSYRELSDLLRSSFLRNKAGLMSVEVGGFKPWSLLQVKTYHYTTIFSGIEFTMQYQKGKQVKDRI